MAPVPCCLRVGPGAVNTLELVSCISKGWTTFHDWRKPWCRGTERCPWGAWDGLWTTCTEPSITVVLKPAGLRGQAWGPNSVYYFGEYATLVVLLNSWFRTHSTVILVWASVRCCCYCWLRALPSLLDQLQQSDSLSTTFFLVNLVINSCPVWAKPVGEPWIASRVLAARESRKHGCQLFSLCTNRIDLGKSDVEPAGITVSELPDASLHSAQWKREKVSAFRGDISNLFITLRAPQFILSALIPVAIVQLFKNTDLVSCLC